MKNMSSYGRLLQALVTAYNKKTKYKGTVGLYYFYFKE